MVSRELDDGGKNGYIQYVAGQEIFTEGSAGKEMYMIMSGKALVSRRVGRQEETIAILEKGDFFGEMAPLTDALRSATVTALENLSVRKLSLNEMLMEMQNDPQFMRDVFNRMAQRLRETTSQLSIALLRKHTEEEDIRVPKVSYLQKKVQEQDERINSLRRQLDLAERKRSRSWGKLLRVLEIFLLLAILAIQILASRR